MTDERRQTIFFGTFSVCSSLFNV